MHTQIRITLAPGDVPVVRTYFMSGQRLALNPFADLEFGTVGITTHSVTDAEALRDAAQELVDAWVLAGEPSEAVSA